jgi:MFS family permease
MKKRFAMNGKDVIEQSLAMRIARVSVLHPAGMVALALWTIANLAVVILARGSLPFDRPAVASMPFVTQVALPTLGFLEIFALMGVVYAITRKRTPPDLAARAPAKATAAFETFGVLVYAMLGQVGGWLLGPALGYRPFSFHIAGTLFGMSMPISPGSVWTWMFYNFIVFAVVPYLVFRRRYSATQLNLKSVAPRADFRLIVTIALIESAYQLTVFPGLLKLSSHAIALAVPLAFLVFFFGTVLPTMVLIYAILLPRYMKLTGSPTVVVLLGGLTYALMHLVEGWTMFTTPRDIALSLIFVFMTYIGPGMFKSFITLRTGNAWVHAIAYHAIAPHVTVDTPAIAKVFGIS